VKAADIYFGIYRDAVGEHIGQVLGKEGAL
jgi:hypothetical protein